MSPNSIAIAGLISALIGSVARAQDVQIDELLAGANGDSTLQFIELRFQQPGDHLWGPQGAESEGRARLLFFDSRDVLVSEFVFPADPMVGVEDPLHGGFSVLLATAAFSDQVGTVTPDFILGAGVLADSGKFCFTGNPDNPNAVDVHLCLAYGDFVGNTEDTSGSPAGHLPIVNAVALQRVSGFDQWAAQSNADFLPMVAAPRNSAGAAGFISVDSQVEQGETLFNRETFQGNGRTCFTCHRPEDQFGLTPDTLDLLPADDPLFVAEFNPDLAELENPCLMRDGRALILENIDGFDEDPVFRTSPHLLNMTFTAPFGLSGEFADLRVFTTGAVQQHFPRTMARNADPLLGARDFRLPTADELAMMEAFMLSIALPEDGVFDLDTLIDAAVARGADAGEIEAGRDLFFGDARCSECHGGLVLAEASDALGGGNQRFNTGVVNSAGNDFEDCLNGPLPDEAGGEREFSVPSLIGISVTAPFFHDGSVETLREAVAFYDTNLFDDSPAALEVGAIDLTDTEIDEITAFLEALVPPQKVINLTQGTGFDAIQPAIDAAVSGDEIEVDPGTYLETLDFNDKAILLRSNDPLDFDVMSATIIDGGGLGTVVTLSSGTLAGFTLQNGAGAGAKAGGVEATGTAVVAHNMIIGNTAEQRGGGVSATDSVVVRQNYILNNVAGNRSGGVSARDNAIVVSNVISGNSATAGGGGVRAQESAIIQNNTIVFNTSVESGSGVIGGGGVLAEDTSTVSNNIIAFTSDGIGLHAATGATLTADFNCLFGNVEGDYGGEALAGPNDLHVDPLLQSDGAHLSPTSPCKDASDPAMALLTDLDIDGGSRLKGAAVDLGADEIGQVRNLSLGSVHETIQGAIDAAGDSHEIVVEPGTYVENIDFLGKTITLRSENPSDESVVNATRIDGAGIGTVVTLSTGVVSGFTITNGGQSGTNAAGVHATGTAVVSQNLITGNHADDRGGGVGAFNNAIVHNNRIVSNTCGQRGGGVNARDDSLVINNVISLNTAEVAAGGVRARDRAVIRNNTLIGNIANSDGSGDIIGGGGIVAENESVIVNNIIAFTLVGSGLNVVAGGSVAADYNCLFANAGGDYEGAAVPGEHDVLADPQFDGTGEHLLPTSPCANEGDPVTATLPDERDIDLEPRIQGGRVDIGVDETAVQPCIGDTNDDGQIDPLDAGFVLARFGCEFPDDGDDCLTADVNGDGSVDPLDTGFVLARFGECE